ncbi:MAG TPA: ABC transporter permease [Actinomycetota bacterium]|nr:ABC transporter permease [Actinomycetota bacterium]
MSWRRALRLATPVLAILGVFIVWDVLVRILDVQPYVVPSPGDALRAIRDDWGTLGPYAWTTVVETVLGFVTGAAVGFLLAVAMSRSGLVQRVVYPVLVGSQAIPIVAIGFPIVLLLGYGLLPKVSIVAFIVFFPVVVNVLDGLASVDRDLLNLARVMDGRPVRVFWLIELPATYTPLFSALKLGATYAVTGAILGEWIATKTRGLGNYLLVQNSRLNTDGVYGAVLLLTAIGVSGFLLVMLFERLATPWRTRATARRWGRAPSAAPSVSAGAPVQEDGDGQNEGGRS